MLTSRRRFLGLAASSTLTLAQKGPAFAAPPIVQSEITPQQFGAKGGDPVSDTLGWNEAVKRGAETGRPILATGTYVLRTSSRSHWKWGVGNFAVPTYGAVQLLSGTHVQSKDGRILVGRSEDVPASRNERHFLFSTELNVNPGTLKDISFDGLTFDFRNEFGPVPPYTYAMAVIGVDGFVRRNLTLTSSRGRAGRGLLAENIRNRADENLKHTNIVQGIYTRYEYGVSMKHISFDGFSEALDFDGPCWDVVLDDLSFKNGRGEAQCIDTAGGARWRITNVIAENVGSVVFIYYKPNGRPTYQEWLQGKGRIAGYVIPEDITVRDVRITKTEDWQPRKHGESLRIGNYRTSHAAKRNPMGGPGPKNIAIEDWTQKGGGRIAVNDCENLTMRRIRISDISVPDDEKGAAIVIREPEMALGGAVTGSVSDVTIQNSQGMGISVVAGSGLSLSNISVENYNLANGGRTRAAIRMRPREGTTSKPNLGAFRVSGGPPGSVDVDR